MALARILSSAPANVFLAVVCLILAGILLLFGISHLVNPDVPNAYSAQNTAISLVLCALGLVALAVAFSIFRRLRSRRAINAA